MKTKIKLIILIIFTLHSCDGETGMDGIVIDAQTGLAMEGVKINMISEYESIEVLSDSVGYFYTKHYYSCGCDCDDSFSVIFKKEGYEDLQLNDNYFSEAEFANKDNSNFHGLLVYVKMIRVE